VLTGIRIHVENNENYTVSCEIDSFFCLEKGDVG
jgi:hypothetical protein